MLGLDALAKNRHFFFHGYFGECFFVFNFFQNGIRALINEKLAKSNFNFFELNLIQFASD